MGELYISQDFFENTAKCMIVLDRKKQIQKVNPAFHQLLGYEVGDVIGKNMDHLSERKKDTFYKKMWDDVERHGVWEGEIWNRKKSGELFLEKRTIFKNKENYIFILEEIDATHDHANKQSKDHITELPSKHLFQETLSRTLSDAEQKKETTAVAMINIERFQSIDKTFGFTIGDQLLYDVAKRMQKDLQPGAFLSRIAGSLFAMILPSVKSEQQIERSLKRIIRNFEQSPFVIDGNKVFISLSIGVSLFPEDGRDEKSLLRNADFARYRAMENGDNNIQFYTPKLNVEMFKRLLLESELRKAVEKNELMLYYQPQIHTQTGNVVGAEALVRWRHRELGIVSPAKFIPLAEETGLIVSIGNWILKEACRQNKLWQDQGLPKIKVSVNISLKQLQQDSFVELLKKALSETGLDPDYLDLEITESMMIQDIDQMFETLNEIKQIGCTISIDDFGTGYSSLRYLARLPIDTLKIDRSFIQNVSSCKEDAAIVETILAMAHELQLKTIAEGVETEEQLAILKEGNCERFQGYLFKPPIKPDEFEQILKK